MSQAPPGNGWAVAEAADLSPEERGVLRAVADDARPAVVSVRHTKRDFWLRRGLAIADAAGIWIAMALAVAMASTREDPGAALGLTALLLPLWLLVLRAYGLYDRQIRRVSHMVLDDLPALFHAVVIGTALSWIVFRLMPVEQLVLFEVLMFALIAMVVVPVLRWAAIRSLSRIFGPERVLIVGTGRTAELLARKMRMHPEYNIDPVGAVTVADGQAEARVAAPETRTPIGALNVLGALDSRTFEDVVRVHRVERVVLSHTDLPESAMLEVLRRAHQLTLKVSVLPVLFDALGPSVEVDVVEGITILDVNPPVLPRSSRMLKRALDVVVASAALIVAAPLFLAIAAGIKLSDPKGPILFRQTRVGLRGQRFQVLKFRTMVQDAEARRDELLQLSADPDWLLVADDPRITRVGRFLRHTSLDELPQLWNVLRGEMSLVGPRPLIEADDLRVDGWARTRLDLTPGITGLWQVLGRTSIPFEEMVKLDYLYVTNWSLWGDVRLLLRTFSAVLRRRGVN